MFLLYVLLSNKKSECYFFSMQKNSCGRCGASGACKRCGSCKVQYYCSVECQRSHWVKHKKQCKQLALSLKRESSEEVREEESCVAGVRLFGSEYRPYLEVDLSCCPGRHGARVGLRNVGNTCYLSCVLQALTYSPLGAFLLRAPVTAAPLKEGFNPMFELQEHAKKVYRTNEMLAAREAAKKAIAAAILKKRQGDERSLRSDDLEDDSDEHHLRFLEERAHMRSLASAAKVVAATTAVSLPTTLLSCTRHAGRMEDAHECLTMLHARLLESCALGYDGKRDEAWERSTVIFEIFGLDLAQVIKCNDCNNESKSSFFEYALRLNATLGLTAADLARATSAQASSATRQRRRTFLHRVAPKKDDLELDDERHLKKSADDDDDDDDDVEDYTLGKDDDDDDGVVPSTSVDRLLELFFEKETLEDFGCEKCKAKGTCGKGLAFSKMPETATLFVDRIPAFGALFGKLNRVVAFDEILDLRPHCLDSNDFLYRLYAVVCHLDFSGSTFFGHYVTYVCDSKNNWWLLDDEKVRRLDWADVKRVNPDILFYTKVPRGSGTHSPPDTSPPDSDDETVDDEHTVVLASRDT